MVGRESREHQCWRSSDACLLAEVDLLAHVDDGHLLGRGHNQRTVHVAVLQKLDCLQAQPGQVLTAALTGENCVTLATLAAFQPSVTGEVPGFEPDLTLTCFDRILLLGKSASTWAFAGGPTHTQPQAHVGIGWMLSREIEHLCNAAFDMTRLARAKACMKAYASNRMLSRVRTEMCSSEVPGGVSTTR